MDLGIGNAYYFPLPVYRLPNLSLHLMQLLFEVRNCVCVIVSIVSFLHFAKEIEKSACDLPVGLVWDYYTSIFRNVFICLTTCSLCEDETDETATVCHASLLNPVLM